ncbi:MAG TPA: T9SS type A sorting domain-containing protein [Ignavibacteriaceae bacterium]|nr:T9SS type A sorting domain-containing protein [Ignavibacteriaceae bacterium]
MEHLSKIRFIICFFFLICINTFGLENSKSDTCKKTADANYYINSYIISSGGTVNASNQNFQLCSTLGEIFTGRMQGTNNILQTGFWSVGLFITDVNNKSVSEIPKTFELLQNFPNPFNPTTTIRFQTPNKEFVSLRIYDLLGKEVTTLVNEEKPAGSYKVTWNAHGLSSGVYFYRLKAGNFAAIKKLVLLK